MSYASDLGTGTVAGIHPATGFPMTDYGYLLNPLDIHDGTPQDMSVGKELYNLTSPYGHLHFACGSGDDFTCFDYETIDTGTKGDFIILDAMLNSETGGFIQGAGYAVLPINSLAEKGEALLAAVNMVDQAEEWLGWSNTRHSRKGWNQDTRYFLRSVAKALFPETFKKWIRCEKCRTNNWQDWTTDRMMRFGGKKIDATIVDLLKGE